MVATAPLSLGNGCLEPWEAFDFHGSGSFLGCHASFLTCILQVGENSPTYWGHLFAGDCHEVEDVRCAGHGLRTDRL